MPEPDTPAPHPGSRAGESERVGDALRAAVERTLTATADSATGTRQRAQSLLDDVVRRGQEARDEVTRRGEEATNRLAEAISELRSAETAEVEGLRARLDGVERRLATLEAKTKPEVEGESYPREPHEKGDSGG